MKMNIIRVFLLAAVCSVSISATAQNRFDALRYSQSQAGFDANSLALSGATLTSYSGFGSIYQNPALAAKARQSAFSLGLNFRDVVEESSYRNTITSFDDQQGGVSDFGYLYSFPTQRGSLSIGGGYNQIANFNRASSLNAFNGSHSIVDYFVISPGDQYFDPAFNTYAVDYDEAFDEYYNVLRADFNYRGMNQYMELKERGSIGEFNVFLATEFQENIIIGGSVGLVTGSYGYERIFIEEDLDGNYIDAIYDVNTILNEDRIDASIRGVNAKIGFLAEPISGIRFGLNYTTKTRLEIDETYSTLIKTEFYTQDADGFNSYEDVYEGDISYTVTKPSVISAGVGMGVLSILDVDLTMERMNYSSIEMGGLGTINNRDENGAIRNDFQDVTNFRAGFTIHLFDTFKPRLGYSVNPSPRRSFDAEIRYLSAGASFDVSDNITLDVGVQVARFDDNLDVYDYGTGMASVGQKVEKVQGMIGLSFRF
jgi:hypothetical protein